MGTPLSKGWPISKNAITGTTARPTPRTERGLLHGYWLLSGYGLHASRALVWLAVTMLTTIMLLMAFGLPQHSPEQEATGTQLVDLGMPVFTDHTP
ncbi:hypothetical protein [Streptomyces sp. NPDC002599]|uniref:hypothetical protein n=1 Tax=Streptomyces sp. NPDC002599 TaxID=3154421 RepID=UPI00332A4532